jgi:hypothetical protein
MRQPDPDKLNAFLGKMVGDLGVIASGALVLLGDQLGLYKAMRDGAKMTAAEVAQRAGAGERHVRETLAPYGAWMNVEPFAHDFCLTNSIRSGASITRPRR